MKKTFPLVITFITGVIIIITFFIPHKPFGNIEQGVLKWYSIIAGFTMLLGVNSLLQSHWNKIKRKHRDWHYSIVLMISFFVMLVAGIISTVQKGNAFADGTSFMWFYQNMIIPLQATMFSLLAFFIASAAYRAFRANKITATLLLVTAIITMLGRVPLGAMIWDKLPGFTDWIMAVPQMAAKRGIFIGVSLGAIAVSLRIILGLERAYLS